MSDLIDRDAAIAELEQSINIFEATDRIKALPSAQPEIIRCKECKHASDDEYCHCRYVTWWNSKDDFCSLGVRREE